MCPHVTKIEKPNLSSPGLCSLQGKAFTFTKHVVLLQDQGQEAYHFRSLTFPSHATFQSETSYNATQPLLQFYS